MSDLQIFDCEQGSEEWKACRLGIPTSSRFKDVLAKGEGKSRKTYLFKLAGEILSGQQMESYQNDDMLRGQDMEAEARQWFEFRYDVEVTLVGFMRRGRMGCSPDGLIRDDEGVEFKSAAPHVLIEHLLRDDIPPAHIAQVQGNLMISGRDRWATVIYWPSMTPPVFYSRPDRAFQANLRGELDRFNDELAAVVEKVRAYGR